MKSTELTHDPNIYTNILQQSGYDINKVEGGAVSVYNGEGDSFNNPAKKNNSLATTTYSPKSEKFRLTVHQNQKDVKDLFTTVENVVNGLGVHEYTGHGVKRYGDSKLNHTKAYELQFNHSSWKKTTSDFKRYMEIIYHEVKASEEIQNMIFKAVMEQMNKKTQ